MLACYTKRFPVSASVLEHSSAPALNPGTETSPSAPLSAPPPSSHLMGGCIRNGEPFRPSRMRQVSYPWRSLRMQRREARPHILCFPSGWLGGHGREVPVSKALCSEWWLCRGTTISDPIKASLFLLAYLRKKNQTKTSQYMKTLPG